MGGRRRRGRDTSRSGSRSSPPYTRHGRRRQPCPLRLLAPTRALRPCRRPSGGRAPFASLTSVRSPNLSSYAIGLEERLVWEHPSPLSDALAGALVSPALRAGASRAEQLLAAVDVEGRTGNGRVRHQVDREGSDVDGTDHATDWKRHAKLLAPRLQLLAEDRRGQRRIDETSCDQIDANGGELERETLRKRRLSGRQCRVQRVARRRSPSAGSAHEEQRSARTNLANGVPGNLHQQQEMRVDVAARLLDVELRERRVVGPGAGDEDVVDQAGQFVEEPTELVEVGGIEGGDAGSQLEAGGLEAVGVSRREDQLGSFLASAARRLESDSGAAADHQHRLSTKLRFRAHAVTSAFPETIMGTAPARLSETKSHEATTPPTRGAGSLIAEASPRLASQTAASRASMLTAAVRRPLARPPCRWRTNLASSRRWRRSASRAPRARPRHAALRLRGRLPTRRRSRRRRSDPADASSLLAGANRCHLGHGTWRRSRSSRARARGRSRGRSSRRLRTVPPAFPGERPR